LKRNAPTRTFGRPAIAGGLQPAGFLAGRLTPGKQAREPPQSPEQADDGRNHVALLSLRRIETIAVSVSVPTDGDRLQVD